MNSGKSICLVACLLTFAAYGATYYWVDGSSDWTDPSSYRTSNGDIPVALPGTGEDDVIEFTGGESITVSSGNAATIALLNKVKYLNLNPATIIFDCEKDMTLECGLYSKGGNVKANVVKKGAGTLQLAAKGKAAMYNNDTYGDVYVNFSVEEGALKFYQGSDLDKTMRVRGVDVAQGAVCWLPIRKKMQIGDLCGSGLVTNDYAAASGVNLGLCGHGSFFGEICGNFGVLVEAGRTDLWGENNSWASETQIFQGAVLGLKRIGDATSGGSAGRSAISIRAGAGGIVYLGSGETFSRDFWSRNRHDRDFVFDAGACGGLDMSGSFTLTSWRESAHMGLYHLKLTGSNTTEAVLSGDIQSYGFDEDNYALFSVTKDGTGTWYLKDIPGGRSFSGVVEVKNGTLKFDSVAEKGVKTSLGTANDLSSQKTGYPRDRDKDEDYAYVLGGGETPGVMEFVGGENCRTTTRPVVLNGIGALVNNSAGSELRIRGVSAMNAGAKTLVLGGASTMENVVWDVTDGEGTVSVEKRGSGSWTLGGASSFSGNLTVKEGTLIVRNDKGAPYKWFKLVIKETASSNPELKPGLTFTDQIGVVEWGLYDGEGRRVNKITNSADGYDLPFETLRPAQIAFTGRPAWVNGDKNAGTYRGATELVDGTWDSLDIRVKYGVAPSLDSPETWMPIVMRLADEAGIVRYYDLFNGDMAYLNRYVTAYTIEGSTDGYSWEEVCSTNGAVTASTKQGWLTGGGEFGDRPGKGIEIRGTGTNDCRSLSAVANVTVASGATLKAVGEIELSSLTVDCASGAGTIEGFSLAASGELRVVNAPRYGCDLPLEFKNARGIANLKQWRVDADGNMDRMELSVGADGKVRLCRKGFLLLCR